MYVELCTLIPWNLIKTHELLNPAYISENSTVRWFLFFLLQWIREQVFHWGVSDQIRKPDLSRYLSRFCHSEKCYLLVGKHFLFRLFPGGQTSHCGVECFVWLHCRSDFSISFNICINCAIGVEVTLKPGWQCGSSAEISLTWQIGWFEFSTGLATRLLNLQWLLALEFVGGGMGGG